MDPTRIAEIRERLNAATPLTVETVKTPAGVCHQIKSACFYGDCYDAQLFLNAPADIRDLLEERERLLELVAHATLAVCKVDCADCIAIELCLLERAALKGGN